MNHPATLERCLAYVELQLGSAPPPRSDHPTPPPTVTLSRQTGAGGIAVAEALAGFLQTHLPAAPAPWTVFHRSLVERVIAEHNLPASFARYMPEDRISYLQDTLEELLGLHSPRTDLVARTTHTILGLSELGNCIIVGRAAHVVLAGVPTALHVRLVGSRTRRIARIRSDRGIDDSAAARFLEDEDAARARYLKAHFDTTAEDPLAYHLVLNTDHFTTEQAAHLIGRVVLDRALAAAPGLPHLPVPTPSTGPHHRHAEALAA